jgi:spore coat polysaccharide biosynthesis protein SpsF
MTSNGVGGKVVGILQARMGSKRLPGKVLADIAGQPMLATIVRRALGAERLDELLIATTALAEDNPVAALARDLGIPCFRGSADDCLDRYYHAARASKAGTVVRLTGDNPFIDAQFVDWVIGEYLWANPHYDYVGSSRSNTFPIGLSVEVFSFRALEIAWRRETDRGRREHVTPYIYLHPAAFRIRHLVCRRNYSHMRWTVDTPEDLRFVRKVFDNFGRDDFGWRDVLVLLEKHPEWLEINRQVKQRVVE